MGIDAEDGGVDGHGPIAVYEEVVTSVLGQVTNHGAGILVIGCDKDASDNVTTFWRAIEAETGQEVTCVNGAANIALIDFAGFAMIAVASDDNDTPSGGLTEDETTALVARQDDIAAHVNGGGGVLGFSNKYPDAYDYLGGLGAFEVLPAIDYDDIEPTDAGLAIGITNELDVCCWHVTYTVFPPFLTVLATDAIGGGGGATGGAAAIGGGAVFISSIQLAPLAATNPVGASHTVTATITENGSPVAGATVTFTVVSGPHQGTTPGTGVTNASGVATFAYTGTAAGIDRIVASYVDSQGVTRSSQEVTKEWIGVIPTPAPTATATPTATTAPGATATQGAKSTTATGAVSALPNTGAGEESGGGDAAVWFLVGLLALAGLGLGGYALRRRVA
jgi:hypothetical protein